MDLDWIWTGSGSGSNTCWSIRIWNEYAWFGYCIGIRLGLIPKSPKFQPSARDIDHDTTCHEAVLSVDVRLINYESNFF